MARDITFEAQMRSNRRWRTIGFFDERESAVIEAERLLEMRRTAAVRVMQLVFDTDNGLREHTVFKASVVDEENSRAIRAATADGETGRSRARLRDGELFRPLGIPVRSSAPPRKRAWPAVAAAALLCLAGLAASLLRH